MTLPVGWPATATACATQPDLLRLNRCYAKILDKPRYARDCTYSDTFQFLILRIEFCRLGTAISAQSYVDVRALLGN